VTHCVHYLVDTFNLARWSVADVGRGAGPVFGGLLLGISLMEWEFRIGDRTNQLAGIGGALIFIGVVALV
jgi:hypothetical protein